MQTDISSERKDAVQEKCIIDDNTYHTVDAIAMARQRGDLLATGHFPDANVRLVATLQIELKTHI